MVNGNGEGRISTTATRQTKIVPEEERMGGGKPTFRERFVGGFQRFQEERRQEKEFKRGVKEIAREERKQTFRREFEQRKLEEARARGTARAQRGGGFKGAVRGARKVASGLAGGLDSATAPRGKQRRQSMFGTPSGSSGIGGGASLFFGGSSLMDRKPSVAKPRRTKGVTTITTNGQTITIAPRRTKKKGKRKVTRGRSSGLFSGGKLELGRGKLEL